jgi:hypothetical protein
LLLGLWRSNTSWQKLIVEQTVHLTEEGEEGRRRRRS